MGWYSKTAEFMHVYMYICNNIDLVCKVGQQIMNSIFLMFYERNSVFFLLDRETFC